MIYYLYSDEYNLVLDPINLEFKFRLVFKIRQDHFELYMESLLDRDVELKLGIKIESNSYRRHVKEVSIYLFISADMFFLIVNIKHFMLLFIFFKSGIYHFGQK